MIRVGLNLLFLGEASGGVGRSACELVGALSRRDDVVVEVLTTRDALPVLQREPWHGDVPLTVLPISRSARKSYILSVYAGGPAWALRRRLNVLHSPGNVGPILAPGVASVLTVNDLIWMHAGLEWGTQAEIDIMRRTTKACIGRVDRVVAISEWTRSDLIEHLCVRPDRVDVVPLGVRQIVPTALGGGDIRQRLKLEGCRIVLCVAQKRPYKRQEAIIRALPDLPADVVAVLPGTATPYESQLRALAQELSVSDRVVFPSWLSDPDLDALYESAEVCAFPSIYEGFGLPVLEAMARGIPVVCSNRAALPEVAGDAALLFDPDDQSSVVAALRGVLGDAGLRARLTEAGRRRAADCSWERTAEKTVDVYRTAHETRKRNR